MLICFCKSICIEKYVVGTAVKSVASSGCANNVSTGVQRQANEPLVLVFEQLRTMLEEKEERMRIRI